MRSTTINKARKRHGPRQRMFVLQWHVTASCGEDCGHCYAKDSPDLEGQLMNELDIDTCMKVLDSYHRFLQGSGLTGRVNLTGGDPLLKDGLFDIIEGARKRGMKVGILGNPSRLDIDMARRLKKAGVFRYQVSIDGLRNTHDRLRGRSGHFDETMRAIEVLNEVDLPSVVMFTLSRNNVDDLPAVAELISDKKVRIFDFARLVPQGRGDVKDMLGPEEYREALMDILDKYRCLELRGTTTYFGRKEALWNLLYLEKDLFKPPKWDGKVYSGCSAGSTVLTVLADGTIYPCRRLPIYLGKVPQDEIAEVFYRAKEQIQLRNVLNFKKCSNCSLLPFCRGCPGVAFGAAKDPFAPDPQCWRKDGDGELTARSKKGTELKDFVVWSKGTTRPCASCDGACGGCSHICAACSEVCASCSGCGDS